MKIFKLKVSEIVGDRHKDTVLVIQTTDTGTPISMVPELPQGFPEGGPDPGGEATL